MPPGGSCFQCDLARDQSLNLKPVNQQQGHRHFGGLFYCETKTKEGSLARLGGTAYLKSQITASCWFEEVEVVVH